MPNLLAGSSLRPQNPRLSSRIHTRPAGHGRPGVLLLFLFAVLGGSWFGSGNAASAQTPTEVRLHPGEPFPRFSGTTVLGKSVQLPPDAPHGAAVLVFSFSRSAAGDARSWDEHLAKDYATDVPAEAVIVLESVPKLFRGMAVGGIKSSMPAPVQARTVILYHGERSWEQRLAVTATDRAYVLLLDRQNRIVWQNSAPYSSEQYAQMRQKIATLMVQP